MSAETVAKSMGHHAHWGFSSGFDFVEAFLAGRNNAVHNSDEAINILLVQPGDIRHILYTISRRRRHRKHFGGKLLKVNFYLLESPIEALARDLLLLQVLTDFEVPIRQRANVFLEIFGNNHVQKRTGEYIESLGKQLKLLSAKGTGQLDHVIDFCQLNYREKDMFEAALQAYAMSCPYEMDKLYDHRQRGLYEDRFDSRKALADWDYHAGIKNKASIVHIKQYRQWRHNGIAYEFGDQTYSEPNRTMMTYTEGFIKKGKEKGLKKEVKGFWGDIVCSPYFALGIDCDTPNKHAEGLYEIINKNTGTEQHRHHAVEISLYNMYSFLWEIETGAVYSMTKANDIYSGLGQQDKLLTPTTKAAESDASEATADAAGAENMATIAEGENETETENESEGKDLADLLAEECEQANSEDAAAQAAASGIKDADLPPPPPSSTLRTSGGAPGQTSAAAVPSGVAARLVALEKAKKQEAALVKAIQRAQTIAESYDGVKIYPMTGTLTHLLTKAKLQQSLDGIFVSSRAAQILGEAPFRALCRDNHTVVAVETAKFLVPLNKDTQAALIAKERELAAQIGLTPIPAPVPRRRRDELDLEDDVLFFRSN